MSCYLSSSWSSRVCIISSICLRSRFVGRPVPGSRDMKIVSRGVFSLSSSDCGVLSVMYWSTFLAGCLFATSSNTSYVYVMLFFLMDRVSLAFASREGLQ